MINKKKKIMISSVLILALIFSMTYYLVNKSINDSGLAQNSQAKLNTDANVNKLEDNVKVSLFAGDKKEADMTISQIKKELNINGDMTQDQLIKILNNSGYNIDVASNGQIMFKRESSKNLEPNKYYIGNKDGYLAIYETDNEGVASVKENEDVFSDNKPIENLRDSDKNKIKNFELKYDSKNEAEESISELIS